MLGSKSYGACTTEVISFTFFAKLADFGVDAKERG